MLNLTTRIMAASAECLEHSVPVEFTGSSNQPISCFSIAPYAVLRIRRVMQAPETVNMYFYKSVEYNIYSKLNKMYHL